MRKKLIWMKVHVPRTLSVAFLAAVAVEITLGALPANFPWELNIDARWGLLLPLVTASICAMMLYSGLGVLEISSRSRWKYIRIIWCLAIGVVFCIPVFWTNDGLYFSGSLRNRMIIYALTCLTTILIRSVLAVLTPTFVMFVSMLAAGTHDAPAQIGLLTQPASSSLQLLLSGVLLIFASFAYGFCYPPKWARARDFE